MTADPIRFRVADNQAQRTLGGNTMEVHPDGPYVLLGDYARLKAEVERLTQFNDTLALRYDATKSMLDGCAKEIEEMEAEVERLTKAGDAMVEIVNGTYCVEPPQALKDWHAARGVQS